MAESKQKDVYKMKLHDTIYINTDDSREGNPCDVKYYVTRVPSGWIYKNCDTDCGVFVPFEKVFRL